MIIHKQHKKNTLLMYITPCECVSLCHARYIATEMNNSDAAFLFIMQVLMLLSVFFSTYTRTHTKRKNERESFEMDVLVLESTVVH